MTSGERPTVSIIVPCRNEARYIVECLDSILDTTYPADRLELLVVDGESDDGTRALLDAYCAEHPAVRVIENPRRITPCAMNAGIRAAGGEIIMRMDAHVTYPREYVPELVGALLESGADNVGGVIRTLPADGTPLARAIAIGLSHRLGVGNSWFRVGTGGRRWVDSLAFGCYRRDVFERIGLFDEELVRNQDDELNFRLTSQGGRLLLVPDVVASYYARRTLRQLARMYYQYGLFKPLVARKLGRIMTVRQLVPALVILAVIALGVAGIWWPVARWSVIALVASYAVVVVAASARSAARHGIPCGAALLAVFPVLHFGYGLGYLHGVWRHVIVRKRGTALAAATLSR